MVTTTIAPKEVLVRMSTKSQEFVVRHEEIQGGMRILHGKVLQLNGETVPDVYVEIPLDVLEIRLVDDGAGFTVKEENGSRVWVCGYE